MTITTNKVWYCNFGNGSSTGYYAIASWAATTAYAVGQMVRQNAAPTIGNERVFVCIVAGTSLGSEPTWVVTKGAKTAESGGPTWMECTGLPGLNGDLTNTPLSSQNRSGSQNLGNFITNNTQDHYFIVTTAGVTGASEPTYNTTTGATTLDSGCTWTCLGPVSSFTTAWAAAHNRIGNALALNWGQGGGATVYVSSSHAEANSTTTISWGAGGNGTAGLVNIICVANVPSSIPPVASDITTGASLTTSGINVTLSNNLYMQGLSITFGGASANTFQIGSLGNSTYTRMDNCVINWTATIASSGTFGATPANVGSLVELNNTVLNMTGNASARFAVYGHLIWRNTPSALTVNAGTQSIFSTGGGANILCEGVDFSAATTLTSLVTTSSGVSPQRICFTRCKFPSGVPMTNTVAASAISGYYVDAINCDSGGNTYYHQHVSPTGVHTSDIVVIRTGGASDGTTGYSWSINPTGALCSWTTPFETVPMVVWNTVTGANRTVTLYGIWNSTILPTNAQIWMSVKYFGTASSTYETTQSTGLATILSAGANLTADTSAWDSKVSARLNSQSYSAGNMIKTTSNPGRVFICTSGGTSNGSEPAGYATAVDGGSVTDGTAIFRAMVRFSIATTLSSPQPQSAGFIYVYAKTSLASISTTSNTVWIDPSIKLS